MTHSITHDRLRLFAQTSGYLSCLSFSPDGRLLAAVELPSGKALPGSEFAQGDGVAEPRVDGAVPGLEETTRLDLKSES